MSVVSSYMIFGNTFTGDFKEVINKILLMAYGDVNDDFEYVDNGNIPLYEDLQEPILNERGTKMCQFGELRCFGLNHFNDVEFEEWLHKTKPKDVTVLLQKEHESQPRIIYTNKLFEELTQ